MRCFWLACAIVIEVNGAAFMNVNFFWLNIILLLFLKKIIKFEKNCGCEPQLEINGNCLNVTIIITWCSQQSSSKEKRKRIVTFRYYEFYSSSYCTCSFYHLVLFFFNFIWFEFIKWLPLSFFDRVCFLWFFIVVVVVEEIKMSQLNCI